MAKTKISEFSTTPGNNTDINGINISEGCAPSGINNAIRELMSDLKEWQSGAMDVYVIPQGTAAAPGIQLYGDLDTGLYGYAANQLGVAVGGASAGYFSSAGWVGNVNGTITGDINATTIDTTNLEVTNIKAKDGTAAITIANSTGVVSVSTTLDLTTVEVTNIKAKDGTAAIALTDSTGVVTLARTTSATNSVNEMLVLEHYSTGTISAGFGSGIKFFGENTGGGNSVYAAIHAVWEGGIGDPSGGALVFLTDGYVGDNTERVRITSEGKVGIGTATPSTTLEVAGSATVTGATTLSATTQNIALGTSQTTGTWTAGGASQTGALTLDQSTKTHTLNLGTGATESGLTKTINLGTGGVSTSTTAINIGSANGTSTTLNGTVTAATLNSTTIDTTNIEVTNIKAKDGTAALSIADSTGVVSVSANPVLSGGTANGVVYLNASKVATSGSALTYDGSYFTAASGTGAFFADIMQVSGTATKVNANGVGLEFRGGATPNITSYSRVGSAYLPVTLDALTSTFSISGTERMRLNSTSLNIGGNFTSTNNTLQVTGNAAIGYTTAAPTTGLIVAGNVGVGTDAPRALLDLNTTRSVKAYWGTAGTLGETQSTAADYVANNLFVSAEAAGTMTYTKTTGDSGNAILQDFSRGITFYTGVTGAATTTGTLNNFERMRLDSSGNLGIGTSSPGQKLSVNGDALVGTNLFIGNGAGSMVGATAPSLYSPASATLGISTGGTERMRIDSSGNLGIATNNPTAKLHVQSDNTSGTAFKVRDGGTPTGNLLDISSNAYGQSLLLTGSGNLGLGVTPTSGFRLDVQAARALSLLKSTTGTNDVFQRLSNTGGNLTLGIDDSAGSNQTGTAYAAYLWSTANSPLIFATNNAERARITSGGYFKASNNGNYDNSSGTYHEFYQTANSNCLYLRATNASYTSSVLGVVGDRTTTNGTYNLVNVFNGNSTGQFIVRDSGNAINTNGSYGTISDQRLKQDIVDAGSQWEDLKAIRFRKYRMKADVAANPDAPTMLGVVAQELEQTSPGLVETTADRDAEGNDLGTTTKSVKTSVLLMKAAVALQEAMARIEKLEAEVAALKGV